MITLFIDTANSSEVAVGLFINGEKYLLKKEIARRSSQVVLPLIEEILKRHKMSLHDLTSIEVHTGPGSFTGVRVGVSIANALGFTLEIPVNGRKTPIEPLYSQ